MSVDLQSLSKLLTELTESGSGVEEAIAATELRLKQLRALKSMLGVKEKPAPRAKKKGGEAA